MPPKPPTFTILFLGDIVLARLIDALLPTSISRLSSNTEPEDAAATVDRILQRTPSLRQYNYASPWGNSLSLLRSTDLILGNLECALTTAEEQWPDKVFNYRSHPENVRCLVEAGFAERIGTSRDGTRAPKPSSRGYVSLANNHILDWDVSGMEETVSTLSSAGISFAGAGRSKEEAEQPARLSLNQDKYAVEGTVQELKGETENRQYEVHAFSFSDHPSDWSKIEGFNFIDYTPQSRQRMKRIITSPILLHSSTTPSSSTHPTKPALRVVSLHCGPNYTPNWHPSTQITSLTHYLIDECDVDIIVNHSAHHILGAEIYQGKLILYGLGDLLDDYAVVSGGWRNDLSGAWRVSVEPDSAEERRVRG
jgi:poly-gamma-glutamate capsule biosynthesis protein CapA/YwtB (metallophosphatase superfamily)